MRRAKTSQVTRIADCGHEYTGYTFIKKARPYCSACITEARAEIDRVNAERRATLAAQPRPTFRISRTVRLSIYDRDDWTCQLCSGPVEADTHHLGLWSATLDHIIPRSKGGSDDPENLRLAHRWCNSVRGDESCYTAADLAA